jgi:hypothetical protein
VGAYDGRARGHGLLLAPLGDPGGEGLERWHIGKGD